MLIKQLAADYTFLEADGNKISLSNLGRASDGEGMCLIV